LPERRALGIWLRRTVIPALNSISPTSAFATNKGFWVTFETSNFFDPIQKRQTSAPDRRGLARLFWRALAGA
jgi:hypothetical protein